MKRNRLKYQSPPAPAAPGPPPTSKPRRGLANGAGSRGCRLPLLKCDLFFFLFNKESARAGPWLTGGDAPRKRRFCAEHFESGSAGGSRFWAVTGASRPRTQSQPGRAPGRPPRPPRPPLPASGESSPVPGGASGPPGALVRTQFTREKAERPPTFRQSEEPGTSRPLGGGRGGGQVNRSGLGSCVFLLGRLLTLETGLIGGSGRALRSGPGSVLVAESHLARHSPGKLSHRGGIHLPSIPTGEQAMRTVLVKRKHVQWPNYPKKHSARLNVSCVFVMTFNTCKIFFFVKT